MSSTMRGSNARRSSGEESYKRIVRRITSLPRNILEGCSRVMNQGIDLIGIGRRANQYHHNHHHHNQQPLKFPFQNHPSNFLHPQEEWSFLTNFEQQYGTTHPFFYACRFKDVMKIARDEHKFVFMYVHSPENPFVSSFCRETLCSEVVVQFLDSNFVCWGGLSSGGEGMQMATALRACTFPFCAVVAPANGDNQDVIQQIEGPVSPAELLEILQRTMEEQRVGFGSEKAKQDETTRANRRLREEQDVAYATSLQIDQEKETLQKKPVSAQTSQKAAEATQILIRFPNGERRECSFLCTDNIRAIYEYINSLGLTGGGNYRLISNFPRKVYGEDHLEMSLKDCGLHPKASLFLELI